MRKIATAAVLLGLAAGMAGAQGPAARPGAPARPNRANGPRVTGQITKVAGTVYTVKQQNGQSASVTIPASTPVMKMGREKASVKDLKAGVNIAANGTSTGTNKLTARRVMILPPMTMGTVQSLTASKITVKTAEGKTVSYNITAKTRKPQGDRALKAGDRVVVLHTGSTADAIRHAGRGMRGPGGNRPGARTR